MKPKGIGSAGLVSWVHSSLSVDDFETAIHFFEEAFGFEVLFKEEGMEQQIESITGTKGLVCDLVTAHAILAFDHLTFPSRRARAKNVVTIVAVVASLVARAVQSTCSPFSNGRRHVGWVSRARGRLTHHTQPVARRREGYR